MKNKYVLIPVASLFLSVVGPILVACHVLLPGIIISVFGLIGGVVVKALERRLTLPELLAFIAFIVGILLFVISIVGFTAYTVLDYVNIKDIG